MVNEEKKWVINYYKRDCYLFTTTIDDDQKHWFCTDLYLYLSNAHDASGTCSITSIIIL